ERYRGTSHDLMKDRVAAVEALDSRHVRFTLKKPWTDFLTFYASATGAGWIVPKKYLETVGDDGFKKAPIGAGPYKLVSLPQRVRQAANLAIDRKIINEALTLGRSRLTNSIIPESFEFYWQPPAPVYEPAQAKRLLAEAGYPNGFDAGEYYTDASYSNVAEAVLDNLGQVGIRTKLRPLERAAFFKAYADKALKNLIQGGSGAFGNAATRLEAFVVKGGNYAYGNYPEIDALFQ